MPKKLAAFMISLLRWVYHLTASDMVPPMAFASIRAGSCGLPSSALTNLSTR
jgi:hypothetical protein